MRALKYFAVGVCFSLAVQFSAHAQNGAVVVPLGDDFFTIPIPTSDDGGDEDSLRLVDRIGKPIIVNRGFDQSDHDDTMIDPTVNIELRAIRGGINGHAEIGLIYAASPADIDVVHWGLQTVFPTNLRIYARGVLLIDRGDFAEGGPFEFSFTGQTQMSLFNIVRRDRNDVAWIRGWTDPRPGDKVWFYLQSDDERLSSNPITFTWPDSIF